MRKKKFNINPKDNCCIFSSQHFPWKKVNYKCTYSLLWILPSLYTPSGVQMPEDTMTNVWLYILSLMTVTPPFSTLTFSIARDLKAPKPWYFVGLIFDIIPVFLNIWNQWVTLAKGPAGPGRHSAPLKGKLTDKVLFSSSVRMLQSSASQMSCPQPSPETRFWCRSWLHRGAWDSEFLMLHVKPTRFTDHAFWVARPQRRERNGHQ